MSFDPAFILHAAEAFVRERWPAAGPIPRLLFARRIPPPEPVPPAGWPGLNAEQARAVEEMTRTPLYLLWGPPGTGKTTTLGVAITR